MTRLRPSTHAGPPTEPWWVAASQDRTDYDALVETVSGVCEWCKRNRKLDPHHVAQGFRDKTLYLIRLIALLCRDCHNDAHALPAEHGRSLGLAIIYHAGRGNNLELLWDVTDREWPPEQLVELWIRRICQRRNQWT